NSASYPGMLIVAASKHFGEAGPERRIAVHQPDLLLEGELVEQRLRPLLDLCIGQRFGGRQGTEGISGIKLFCHHRVSFSWLFMVGPNRRGQLMISCSARESA